MHRGQSINLMKTMLAVLLRPLFNVLNALDRIKDIIFQCMLFDKNWFSFGSEENVSRLEKSCQAQ